MKSNTFFVISNFNNDLSWINDYPENDYIIYDKSNSLSEGEKILKVENVGHNIFDSLHFIILNYENLPEYTAFLQGKIWDHCQRSTFDKLILKKEFVPIEDYSHVPESYAHHKDTDGGYLEVNSSWILHLDPPYKHRYFNTYDQFMHTFFTNYEHIDWIRFAPGGMYIVPKENILYYTQEFYRKLLNMVCYDQYTMEAHLIERCVYYIYSNKYEERKDVDV